MLDLVVFTECFDLLLASVCGQDHTDDPVFYSGDSSSVSASQRDDISPSLLSADRLKNVVLVCVVLAEHTDMTRLKCGMLQIIC